LVPGWTFNIFDNFGSDFYLKKLSGASTVAKLVDKRTTVNKPEMYGLPSKDDVPNLDYQVITYHRGLLGVQHSKMILIDGQTAIMGSKNMDKEKAMEYMFVMEGPVTMSLRDDFESMWLGSTRGDGKGKTRLAPPPNAITAPRPGDFPMLVVGKVEDKHKFKSKDKNPQNAAWKAAMAQAKVSAYIQSPNTGSPQFYEAVMDALTRGVAVTIVTAFHQQDTEQDMSQGSVGNNEKVGSKMYKKLNEMAATTNGKAKGVLKYCWFIGKDFVADPASKAKVTGPLAARADNWAHVKAMIIDDHFAIIGSGNQDSQSWFHSREQNVLLDNPTVAKGFHDMLISVQRNDPAVNCHTEDMEPEAGKTKSK